MAYPQMLPPDPRVNVAKRAMQTLQNLYNQTLQVNNELGRNGLQTSQMASILQAFQNQITEFQRFTMGR